MELPLYGVEGQGWFLGIHCFTNYVKVVFFRGTSLRPVPPGQSKSKDTRYLDIHEADRVSGRCERQQPWRKRRPP